MFTPFINLVGGLLLVRLVLLQLPPLIRCIYTCRLVARYCWRTVLYVHCLSRSSSLAIYDLVPLLTYILQTSTPTSRTLHVRCPTCSCTLLHNRPFSSAITCLVHHSLCCTLLCFRCAIVLSCLNLKPHLHLQHFQQLLLPTITYLLFISFIPYYIDIKPLLDLPLFLQLLHCVLPRRRRRLI